jgi:hypothetical protein
MFNSYDVKYISPRNLNDFDYTAVFYRFNPKNILEEIKIKKGATQDGWVDSYVDSTNHNEYEENDISEIIKGILLNKRKQYNNLVDKDRQISDDLIYKLIGNKDLTLKEKLDIVNFIYFLKDNDLIVEKDEDNMLYDVFDFIAYTKAFNIQKQAQKNALSGNPKSIHNKIKEVSKTEEKENKHESKNEIKKEVKPKVPDIEVKNYISRSYYNSIDEDQEENIEWAIKDLYEIAIDKLNLTNIKEITEAIKNLMADNYVENDIALEIFKKVIQDDNIRGVFAVNMPLYREYQKKI